MRIITQRCELIPYEESHIPDILKMFREPDSNKFIQPLKDGGEEFWMEKLRSNLKKNEELLQIWCVYHLENKDFVGTMNLNEFADTGLDQLGLHLSRKYWGQGYGYELCLPLIEHAWKVRKLDALHWLYEKEHHVSGKLAKKLGFEPYSEIEKDGCELFVYKLKKDK
ncbi:MAG: GNAT family N-acetyltransferase [Crocinitomicaceae bacterium]